MANPFPFISKICLNRPIGLWLLSVTLAFTSHVAAQTTTVSAIVQFGNGQTVTLDDLSERVGVQPGEVVTVTIQVGANNVGAPVVVEPLDGGFATVSSAVSDQGVATFSLRAPNERGEDRVMMRYGVQSLRLKFWVLGADRQNNPPVITPATPQS
jgi:hypothetical protein